MPENPSALVELVNRREQPVELHYGAKVVVVPPLGSLVVASDLAQTPQIEVLIRRRLLATRLVESGAESATDALPLPPDETKVRKAKKAK